MENYTLIEDYNFSTIKIPKGAQSKYFKDGYYYKLNKLGEEGFTEYLVSKLLHCTNIPTFMIVDYEYCKINGKLGCRSKSFLNSDEEFISMETLFKRVIGHSNLMNELYKLNNAVERLNYIDNLVKYTNIRVYKAYLNVLLQLDLLIQNTDRHPHNYGIIYNNKIGRYRLPPIFDNGLSLGTDGTNIESATSCTLSGSFEDQVVAFGYPIIPTFKIDFRKLYRTLAGIEGVYGHRREISILKARLNMYGSIFK